MFIDRLDASKKLLPRLEKFKKDNPVILAIPRGGIVIAYEAIKKFNFKWDLIIPRKIGAPYNKEFAIGAVAPDGSTFVDDNIKMQNIPKDYIEKEAKNQIKEIERRYKKYKGNSDYTNVKDRTVIVMDDGIATGFTILAAIKSLKKQGAKKIIVAVPVAPLDTIKFLERLVDEVIVLLSPKTFYAVGSYYESFKQVTDKEVLNMLNRLDKE
ncbi:phosphoribosyltransferase [Thermohalobacter berrensis]|uniref:Phosphoribosyltransferase n=1 Tax=Thermohalobacter berrensis TaxID=99594 RepID=A0A419T7R3_9FIRM|nr:phosphoribosyltransferase family protein [Thermohalobacter berrensis]RKD33463.1 phosphoribosyltransferase [Thermohalobacter berrensis]